MGLGQSASLNGFLPFPADNLWNQDISAAAVDANSAAIINFIGAGIGLHPDFGAGLYQGQSMGIPTWSWEHSRDHCRLRLRRTVMKVIRDQCQSL